MNKKLLLSLVVVFVAIAMIGCGKKKQKEETVSKEKEEIKISTEIKTTGDVLNNVVKAYGGLETFSIRGDVVPSDAYGEATLCDLTKTDSIIDRLHVSAEILGQVDEVACAIEMENENNLIIAAFHLVDTDSMETFAEDLLREVISAKWEGGYPGEITIYNVEKEYVVYVLGTDFYVEEFSEKLEFVYKDKASLLFNEEIEVY